MRQHADRVLAEIIRPALLAVDYQPERIDEASTSGSITTEMVIRLRTSQMCVAVLTGLNPNVMYELGVRHAWDLPVVVLAEKGTQLPFDTRDFNTSFYSLESAETIAHAVQEVTRRVQTIHEKLEQAGGRHPARMIPMYADAMRALGERFSLEPLFRAKEQALSTLVDQLGRLKAEVSKDFERGRVAGNPLKAHAKTLVEEFEEFTAKVSVFEKTARHCQIGIKSRPHCDSILESMMSLQSEAWAIAKKWKSANGSEAAFQEALADIRGLADKCHGIIDLCRREVSP